MEMMQCVIRKGAVIDHSLLGKGVYLQYILNKIYPQYKYHYTHMQTPYIVSFT